MADVHDARAVTVGRTATAHPQRLTPGPRTRVVDGLRVRLSGTVRAGETSDLSFAFTDAATGRPVRDLRPYLNAAGHVVIMGAGGTSFAHEHAETEDADGRTVFALPGQRFGPDLDVHAHVDRPGVYRLWGQFELANGHVVTVPFTVRAS